MAQAKRKTATKTAKKACGTQCKKACTKSCSKNCTKKKGLHYEKYECGQKSNPFFLIAMSMLAASLLFADLIMMTA